MQANRIPLTTMNSLLALHMRCIVSVVEQIMRTISNPTRQRCLKDRLLDKREPRFQV